MKLSREKVLRLSHLILGHLDQDDGVEYFAEPQQVRQDIVKIISDEELLALFPDRSLALIGSPGRRSISRPVGWPITFT